MTEIAEERNLYLPRARTMSAARAIITAARKSARRDNGRVI